MKNQNIVFMAIALAFALAPVTKAARGPGPTPIPFPPPNPRPEAVESITDHAQSVVAFEGHLERTTLVSQTCNGGVCNFVFQGSGSVNIMGRVSWTINVLQDFNITPCNPTLAEVTAVGATGSITLTDTCGIVCPSATNSGFPFTISTVWNVTGGTGQFGGITGSGTNQGTIAGNGPNVGLSGIVVY